MSTTATLTLSEDHLVLRCEDAGLAETLNLTDADTTQLQSWAQRYLVAAKNRNDHVALLVIGKEMHEWLDTGTKFLTRLLNDATAPLILEITVGKSDDSNLAKALLDAPWEVLAHDGRFLALDSDIALCPVRRIGKSATPDAPSKNRLGLVFMAAAPRNADNLDFEAEEASILDATRDLGIDLAVEESGTLALLANVVARERPDVVQISCHGTLTPAPALLLEDEIGDINVVETRTLVNKLAANPPHLLFLSACETAQADPVLPSLARSFVRAGVPAVIGWAASVLDREATVFASLLYGFAANGTDLSRAFAFARLGLSEHESLPERVVGTRSRDWHLARLFFSAKGGDVLATAGGPLRHLDHGRAVKTFLDTKGQQVPVASEFEFVGRRREIQRILREFRTKQHLGVIIHAVGRQGKSSLASRVAHRMEHTHETVVIFGRYDAPFILRTIGDRLDAIEGVKEVVAKHLPAVEAEPAALSTALAAILSGPCRQRTDKQRPMLLVVDDFERALDDDKTTLRPDLVASIRAVLVAFGAASTESRLLFTCRTTFICPDHAGTDLAARLLDIPLHGMKERESRKQAAAKARAQRLTDSQLAHLAPRIGRIIEHSRGNPGLQDLLYTLAIQDTAACDRCLGEMADYLATGTLPSEEKVRAFLENLALQSLIALLTAGQTALLGASTAFTVPVPASVMAVLGSAGDIARLLALGLWEVYEDLYDPHTTAVAINALARPIISALTEAETAELAGKVTAPLFAAWGGEAGKDKRRFVLDHEITHFALLARDARVLVVTGADALFLLGQQFEYKRAAAWAKEIITLVDAASEPATVELLRIAAERCTQVGDVVDARAFSARAVAQMEQGGAANVIDHAATLITHARDLVSQGKPDEAMVLFEKAKEILPPGRERAVVLGDIARILTGKGDVDAALALHKERLGTYEALGDKRERAVTLGDIARILTDKGDVDAALALHKEELAAYEALGDKRSRAMTLGDIARILTDKGDVDAALALHKEELAAYDALGDKRSRAVTLGDIARILTDKGDVDAALALHKEKLSIVEALGDKRSRAVTLGDIARILTDKGDVDAALALQNERLNTNRELGDMDGVAAASFDLAQIEVQQQKWQEAFDHLAESYAIFLKLGRLEGICVVGLDLGHLLCMAGQREQGIAILTRSRDGFAHLGRQGELQHTQAILDKLSQP